MGNAGRVRRAMDVERDFAAFRRCHRDPWNIAFHAVCGWASLSLLFSMVGIGGLVVYAAVVGWAFRRHALAALAAVMSVALGTLWIRDAGWPALPRAAGIVVCYLLPEVSHWLRREPAVLTMGSVTPAALLLNFVMLLPYTLACTSRAADDR